MPFSLRLDPDTEALIRKLTAATGRTKAMVVREAVAHYAAQAGNPADGQSAADRLKPFIGSIRTGGANYSADTHAKYRALVLRKHRATRAR